MNIQGANYWRPIRDHVQSRLCPPQNTSTLQYKVSSQCHNFAAHWDILPWIILRLSWYKFFNMDFSEIQSVQVPLLPTRITYRHGMICDFYIHSLCHSINSLMSNSINYLQSRINSALSTYIKHPQMGKTTHSNAKITSTPRSKQSIIPWATMQWMYTVYKYIEVIEKNRNMFHIMKKIDYLIWDILVNAVISFEYPIVLTLLSPGIFLSLWLEMVNKYM